MERLYLVVLAMIVIACSGPYEQGNEAFEAKDWNKAIEAYSKLLANDKHYQDARVKTGTAYYQLQQWGKAIEFLGSGSAPKSDEILKMLDTAYYKLGVQEFESKNWRKAIDFFSKVQNKGSDLGELLEKAQKTWEKEAFESAQAGGKASRFEAFLQQFPNGNFRAKAEEMRNKLQAEEKRNAILEVIYGRWKYKESGLMFGGFTQEEEIIFKRDGKYEYSRSTSITSGSYTRSGTWSMSTNKNGDITLRLYRVEYDGSDFVTNYFDVSGTPSFIIGESTRKVFLKE